MAQFDMPVIVPTTDTGTTLSNNLNALIPALYSTQSGTNRPPYAVANQLWVSTGTPTEHKLYLFDGTQDQLIASFDPATINSLRTGDGLSKADGGTVVKPVTFDSVITPKKGVIGRTDAPKTGEIGELIYDVGSNNIGILDILPDNTAFGTNTINKTENHWATDILTCPTDGVWDLMGEITIKCDNVTSHSIARIYIEIYSSALAWIKNAVSVWSWHNNTGAAITGGYVEMTQNFRVPVGFKSAGDKLSFNIVVFQLSMAGNIVFAMRNPVWIRVA